MITLSFLLAITNAGAQFPSFKFHNIGEYGIRMEIPNDGKNISYFQDTVATKQKQPM